MIKIKLEKENDQIKKVQIKGHSGYDEYGRDIVCASVSTMTITTINAIIRYDESSISYNQDEGLVNLVVLKHSEVVDLLLENLISLFKELEEQYKKYVKIYE